MELDFDASKYELVGGAAFCFPLDTYPVAIKKVAKKQAKSGGAFLEVVLKVTEGDHAGREQTTRINLWNSNDTAVDIAKRQLATICYAVGIPKLTDTEQLVGEVLCAEIGPQDSDERYSEVKKYLMPDGSEVTKGADTADSPQRKALSPALQKLATAPAKKDAEEPAEQEAAPAKKKVPWAR